MLDNHGEGKHLNNVITFLNPAWSAKDSSLYMLIILHTDLINMYAALFTSQDILHLTYDGLSVNVY